MDIFRKRIEASKKHFGAPSELQHLQYDWVCKNGHHTRMVRTNGMIVTPPEVCPVDGCGSRTFKLQVLDEFKLDKPDST